MQSGGKSFEMPLQEEAGERIYKTGDKIHALDETDQEMAEWTVVDYEKISKILHLKRDLPLNQIRIRVIHADRLKDEQAGNSGDHVAP